MSTDDFLLDGIIPANAFSVLAGDPLVGKTRLAFQIMACFQKGQSLFGHAPRTGVSLGLNIIQLANLLRR